MTTESVVGDLAKVFGASPLSIVREVAKVLEVGAGCPHLRHRRSFWTASELLWKPVTFDEWPTRVVDGERRPILRVWGKWYEFTLRGGVWVQTRNVVVQTLVGKQILTSKKKLTLRQMKLVRRRLRGIRSGS